MEEKGPEFWALFKLATAPQTNYDEKKNAALLLIKAAVEHGNYPILISLSNEKILPVDVRIALENKVDASARTAIVMAYAQKDYALLTDISKDERLSVDIRRRAEGCLRDSLRPDPIPASEKSDPQMAAELMQRMGRNAAMAPSNASDRSERPTLKEPSMHRKR